MVLLYSCNIVNVEFSNQNWIGEKKLKNKEKFFFIKNKSFLKESIGPRRLYVGVNAFL